MSAINDDTVKDTTTRRRNPSSKPKRTGHARRKFTVPTNVNPGWIHNLAAALTVRAMDRRDIDGGKIDDDMIRLIPGAEDAPEPAELLARIYAHAAYRIPGIRSLAKRFEGSDPKSGLGADMLALSLQLWLRNRDLFAELTKQRMARAEADHAESRAREPSKAFSFLRTSKDVKQQKEGAQ